MKWGQTDIQADFYLKLLGLSSAVTDGAKSATFTEASVDRTVSFFSYFSIFFKIKTNIMNIIEFTFIHFLKLLIIFMSATITFI